MAGFFGSMQSEGYLLTWGPDSLFGGNFTFQIGTAAYRKLMRTDTWRWVTQERINNDPAEQYVGRGSKNITLDGVIYASYNPGAGIEGALTGAVGTHVLDLLRFLGDQGLPGTMVDGTGFVMGSWVLVGLREEAEYFTVNGLPQKQAFAVEFRSAGPDNPDAGIVIPPPPVATGADPIDPAFQALASQASPATAVIATTMQNSYGNSTADAKDMAQYLFAVGNTYGKTVKDALPDLANALAAGLTLRGDDFKTFTNVLTGLGAQTSFKDWSSLLTLGVPALTTALGGLKVSGKDAAATEAGILSSLDPKDGDRGVTAAALASEIENANSNSALRDLGVKFDDPTVPPADRYAAALNKMAELENNPTTQAQLTAALPPGTNPNLYDQAIAKSSGKFDTAITEAGNKGLSTTTPYTGKAPQ